MYTNFKVIGLTRLGIKPASLAPETDALTTRPSELFAAGGCIPSVEIVAFVACYF